MKKRILLTTPVRPYSTLPGNESLTDATSQRFTKGNDIFTAVTHTHSFANHILAQNINLPATLLEYPHWDDFTAEVDKAYPLIGISAYPVHLDTVIKMCAYIRKASPDTAILLGSYGAQAFDAIYDPETKNKYVDHVVKGEGVRFLRNLLGENPDLPIEQKLMPKCGSNVPFIDRYPRGNLGFLVSGLGCPGGCDYCATTAHFDFKRIQLLNPKELVEHIYLYHKNFPELRQVFVIEEDHFRQPEYLFETKRYWENNPEVVSSLDWVAFGSVDYIQKFADKYGWETVAEIGVGAIFIGVESKFAGDHGYEKRKMADARVVFAKLHEMGVRTIGAWMCGWDFHDHFNIYEDLNYFVACYPTFQQLTRVSPLPGTPFYDEMAQEGRINNVPWEDVHFLSGALQNKSLEAHETLNLIEYGYELLYRTWGPSLLRRFDVMLNGYEFCLNSPNEMLRQYKSLFFKRQCALQWTAVYAMDRFAPNGIVRRRVRKCDERYRRLIGQPTPVMQFVAKTEEILAKSFKQKQTLNPFNRHIIEQPFKRYLYDRDESTAHLDIPYRTQYPHRQSLKEWTAINRFKWQAFIMSQLTNCVRLAYSRRTDPIIDDYIIKAIAQRSFIGF